MKPKSTSPFDPCRCENCAHFHRHYVANRDKTVFRECGMGHCTESRLKHVKEFQTCGAFRPACPMNGE